MRFRKGKSEIFVAYRVLQNDTHFCFWGCLPAQIVVGLPKHISGKPIDWRLLCSQFGDQMY